MGVTMRGGASATCRGGRRCATAVAALCTLLLFFAVGTAPAAPPALQASFGSFLDASGVAVEESTGNVFVADAGANVVQIFGPEGGTPTGVAATTIEGFSFNGEPTAVAVDNSTSVSAGALYVADVGNSAIKKFVLNPVSEEYELDEELSATGGFSEPTGVTVDTEGNVFVGDFGSSSVIEFSPTGTELGRIEYAFSSPPSALAVDAAGDLFVQPYAPEGSTSFYKFAANGSGDIEPGTSPTEVITTGRTTGLAVDLDSNRLYLAMLDHVAEYDASSLTEIGEFGEGDLSSSERLAVNSFTGDIYVADPTAGAVALFRPPPPAVPTVVTLPVGPVTASTAVIGGTVTPNDAPTTYYLEYSQEEDFGTSARIPASGDASAGSGDKPVHVFRLATGLAPGTTYFYRVVAENPVGPPVLGATSSFETLAPAPAPKCPNEEFRTGPSTGLPDCRAYELATPADTNAMTPLFGVRGIRFGAFDTLPAAPSGDSVLFGLNGGALPGTSGPGFGDLYEAVRGANGWVTAGRGPSAAQSSPKAETGGVSDDHGYAIWGTQGTGTLSPAEYIRYPDGSFHLLGDGSLADDPNAVGRWISPGGRHIIFTSQVQLESEAAADVGPGGSFFVLGNGPNEPVGAIYDRTASGLEVLSLLPGDETPPPGSSTYYRGYSADGSTVAFNVNGTMYVRRDGSTVPIVTTSAPGEVTFEGVSRDGSRVFYLVGASGGLLGGELFVFDVAAKDATQIGTATDAQVVNVSADGSHVYFVSGQVLPDTAGAAPGANNLYGWDGGDVRFIAQLADEDRALWKPGWGSTLGVPQQQNSEGPVSDPSRTTPDGSILVFESRRNLTSFDAGGLAQVYRFDFSSGALACLSCNPSGGANSADALLQGDSRSFGSAPTNSAARIANVTDDGQTVFFMSGDALERRDGDGLRDVYEWKQGRVSLISYGHSAGPEWLYGMTPDGDDVFFTSNAGLTPQKGPGTLAIYDARVGGGFPGPATASQCLDAGCQAPPGLAPAEPAIGTAGSAGPGNQAGKAKRHRCKPRGGKPRGGKRGKCKRPHKKRHQQRSANTTRGADR